MESMLKQEKMIIRYIDGLLVSPILLGTNGKAEIMLTEINAINVVDKTMNGQENLEISAKREAVSLPWLTAD